MVNANLVIGLSASLASVIVTIVILSSNGNINMTNLEPLGQKSKWAIAWPKEGIQQVWTIDLTDADKGADPHMLIETDEDEWRSTQVFKDKMMISFEGLSYTKAISMCKNKEGEEFDTCMVEKGEIKNECESVDSDMSHIGAGNEVSKPVQRGIRRTMRRNLVEEFASRKLTADEEADLAARLEYDGYTEEEQTAIMACVFGGECDSAGEGEEVEENAAAVEEAMPPVTLGNGQVLSNALIIGTYVVALDTNGVPTKIISAQDGSILANIVGIYPWSEGDETRMAIDRSCEQEEQAVEEEAVEGGGRMLQISNKFTGADGVEYAGKTVDGVDGKDGKDFMDSKTRPTDGAGLERISRLPSARMKMTGSSTRAVVTITPS
ncbi:hypothetical protein ScalyP_jg12097 [Parmales sp. scaly parma]|nr:hypothetical protein ScalyP_jg12097 [Parmales sp. scaly parma]